MGSNSCSAWSVASGRPINRRLKSAQRTKSPWRRLLRRDRSGYYHGPRRRNQSGLVGRKRSTDLRGPAQQLLPNRHIEEPERDRRRGKNQHPHRTTLIGLQREDCADKPYRPEDVDPGTRNHQTGNDVREDANDEVGEKADDAQDSLGPNSLRIVRLRIHGREATFQPISAPVAQRIERRRPKAGVGGSTPSGRTVGSCEFPANPKAPGGRRSLLLLSGMEHVPTRSQEGTPNWL